MQFNGTVSEKWNIVLRYSWKRCCMHSPCTSSLISTVSGSMRAILLTLHVNVAPNSSRVICISSKLLPVPILPLVIVDELVAEIKQFISLDQYENSTFMLSCTCELRNKAFLFGGRLAKVVTGRIPLSSYRIKSVL